MKLTCHTDAADFLSRVQTALERNEAANNLMIGIAVRLKEYPDWIKSAPYLATVADHDKLLAAAVMTPPQRVIIHAEGADPAPLRLIVQDLVAAGWPVPGVIGPAEVARAFAEVWGEATGQQPGIKTHERIYELRQVIAPVGVPGQLRVAVEADIARVAEWLSAFHQELGLDFGADTPVERAGRRIDERLMYLWDAARGQSVSLAARSRHSTHGVCIGPVYTPPTFRRRGYAGACVAALSQQMLDAGWAFCVLFTDLANPTSNSVYQKIGYRPVCDFDEWAFEPPADVIDGSSSAC